MHFGRSRQEAGPLKRGAIAEFLRLLIVGLLEIFEGLFIVLPRFGVLALGVGRLGRIDFLGENRKNQAEQQQCEYKGRIKRLIKQSSQNSLLRRGMVHDRNGHAASGRAKKPSDRATQGLRQQKYGKSDYSIARSCTRSDWYSVFTLIGTLPWVAGVRKKQKQVLPLRQAQCQDDKS